MTEYYGETIVPMRVPIDLANVLRLCVRRRPCSEVPDAIRWVVTLPGCWGEGFPTQEAAEAAILARAREVTE